MARPIASIVAAGALLFSATQAHARQIDLIASGAISPANNSDYRNAATALGYDTRGKTVQYEAEFTAQFGVAEHGWITLGPLLRGSFGRLGAPYDGVQPISTDGAFAAARLEAAVFDYPRLFFWADAGLGVTMIGHPGAYTVMPAWGVRGGAGMRLGTDRGGARLRVGYSYAPTFGSVTPATGKFDYGGFVLALDGVLRVLG